MKENHTTAEPAFVPKAGQVDFTHIRYAPVVNTVVTHKGKILLVKRSEQLRLYPGYWNGISGFLDDQQSIAEKVAEELREELGLTDGQFTTQEIARPLRQEAPEYGKTWLVVPVLVGVTADRLRLDWEASRAQWFMPEEVKSLQLLPGFSEVLAQFF